MNLILFLLEFTALLSICHNILHLKRTHSRGRLAASLLLTLLWAGYIFFSEVPIPNIFINLAIIFLLYSERWYLKICLVFVYTLFTNVMSNSNIYLYCMASGSHSITNISLYIVSDVIVLLSILLLTILCRKKSTLNPSVLYTITAKGYFLILLVAFIDFFLSSVSSLFFYDTLNITGKYLLIIAILIVIIISIFLVVLYFRLRHYHAVLQEKNRLNQKMLDLEICHYEDICKKNNDLRAFRHDYNFHITAMQALAADSDLDGLKKYVGTLSNIKEQNQYIITNHPISDAIINYFYETLPVNTTFEVEGKFSADVFVDDSDLCIILSNLLKNAVEAVEKEASDSACSLFISLYSDTDYLTILVENTASRHDTSPEFSTTKGDSVNHGFGLKNVEAVVNKYNGTLELQHKNDLFTAYCYLRNLHSFTTHRTK